MRRLTTTLILTLALLFGLPAATSSAFAAPPGENSAVPQDTTQAYRLEGVYEYYSTCRFIGAIGVWQGYWRTYYCEYSEYLGGWALYVE